MQVSEEELEARLQQLTNLLPGIAMPDQQVSELGSPLTAVALFAAVKHITQPPLQLRGPKPVKASIITRPTFVDAVMQTWRHDWSTSPQNT